MGSLSRGPMGFAPYIGYIRELADGGGAHYTALSRDSQLEWPGFFIATNIMNLHFSCSLNDRGPVTR